MRVDTDVPAVAVGPFTVADLPQRQVVEEVVRLARTPSPRARTAFALHVGGLLARHDEAFVTSMDAADLVYADGVSVVKVAQAAGAQTIERAPTTDIGWDVLQRLTEELGRPPLVSVVGGRPGVAHDALRTLVQAGVARPGLATHGYHQEWDGVLDELAEQRSDVLVLGLGAPLEMQWATQHADRVGGALVLTCGGWLGFLAGHERRAPALVRRLSLEWAYRLLQDPRRLFKRYGVGAVVTAMLYLRARS